MTPLGAGPAQSTRYTAALVLIGAGLAALWWSISAGNAGALPLAVVGVTILIARRFDASVLRRTALDLPLMLFLLTALIGIWAAYDRDAAQSKFWMLLGAYVLYYALAAQPGQNLWLITALLGGLGFALAFFFLLTHDWQAFPPKFALVQSLAHNWTALRPTVNIQGLHPNVAASLMALLAPFQLAGALRARRTGNSRRFAALVFVLAFTTLALLLTSSRGATAALAGGLLAWLLWSQSLKRRRAFLRRVLLRHGRLLFTLLGLTLAAVVMAIAGGWGRQIARVPDFIAGPAGAVERAQLANHTIDLIADFPFTGGGLASFPGLYSQYMLAIPFYFLPNGHNIILDVTLEQGLAGSLALLIILVVTFSLLLRYQPQPVSSASDSGNAQITGAAVASFLVLLFHGMVEDTIYGSIALPLLLAVPGVAIALNHAAHDRHTSHVAVWDRRSGVFLGIVALALLAASTLPQGRALWWANLGAVSMARVELSDFPSDQWDAMQEDGNLREATDHFQRSLRYNPQQRTAHHRLGLLAMQRADYTTATRHLEAVYAHDPAHIGVRKALGYSYAWSGHLQQAHHLLASAPFVAQELDSYEAWWQQQERRDLAQTASEMRAYFHATDNQTVNE